MNNYNYKITNIITGWKYLKTYLIESIKGAAVNSNIDRKSDKNGEPPEVDNPVGSARSE